MKIVAVIHKYGVPLGDPCIYPLGYMYIISRLKELGHSVKVLNYNLGEYDFGAELDDADVVTFTGFEEFYPPIKRDAAICKAHGVKTLVGGALATFRPLDMAEICDTVVIGEGEELLTQALDRAGVIMGGQVDIAHLPYPDYQGIRVDEYFNRNGFRHMGVLTSRGCPFSCTFCAHTCSYQARDLDAVFNEIVHYQDRYDPQLIVFNDNTLNVSATRFLSICDRMTLPWTAAIRLSNLTEDMCVAAKNSGCRYLVVGVESFNQKRLDEMNKGITVKQITDGLDLLEKYGIDYHGNVMVGFEPDTLKDIQDELTTLSKGYKLFPTFVKPFIGTRAVPTTKITPEERESLTQDFSRYIQSKGKYLYPECPTL